MSRKQLAELSGLTVAVLANLENGRTCLKAGAVCALSKALCCSADELLGNKKS